MLNVLDSLLLWKIGEDHYLSLIAVTGLGIYATLKRGIFVGLWAVTFVCCWHELIFHVGFTLFIFPDDWLFIYSILVPFLICIYLWTGHDLSAKFILLSMVMMLPFFFDGFANSLEYVYATNLTVAAYEISTWVGFSILGALYLK